MAPNCDRNTFCPDTENSAAPIHVLIHPIGKLQIDLHPASNNQSDRPLNIYWAETENLLQSVHRTAWEGAIVRKLLLLVAPPPR